MINHVSIGVHDLGAAKRFYDAALKPLGYACISEGESALGYGADKAAFWVLAAGHPVPSDPDSGLHICFAAPSSKSVDEFHAAAIAAGGSDNGKPGPRKAYDAGYYAAFAVDPDGYRLEAYCDIAS